MSVQRGMPEPDPEAPTLEDDVEAITDAKPEPTVARLQGKLDEAGVRYFQALELLWLPKVGRFVRHREIDDGIMRNLVLVARLADYVRAELGVPLYVTSAYRPETYNTLVRGAATSQHLLGKAIDLNLLPNDRNDEMVARLRQCVVRLWRRRINGFGGLGLYDASPYRVHLDVGAHRCWQEAQVQPVLVELESAGEV